jgi:hypothetical protein
MFSLNLWSAILPVGRPGCHPSIARAFSDRLESLRDPAGLKKCSSLTALEQIVRPGVTTPDLTLRLEHFQIDWNRFAIQPA